MTTKNKRLLRLCVVKRRNKDTRNPLAPVEGKKGQVGREATLSAMRRDFFEKCINSMKLAPL